MVAVVVAGERGSYGGVGGNRSGICGENSVGENSVVEDAAYRTTIELLYNYYRTTIELPIELPIELLSYQV